MAEWTVTWASQGIMAKTPEIQITEVSTVEGTIESLQSQGSVERKEKKENWADTDQAVKSRIWRTLIETFTSNLKMNFFEMLVTTASSSHDSTVTELHGCRVCARLKDTLYARLRKIFLSDVKRFCLNLVSCIPPLIKTLFVCIIFHVSVTSYWWYFALYGIFHLPSINVFLIPLAYSVNQFTDSIGAPVILSSRKINSTSSEITWEPVPHYIHGATIVGYHISYYTVQGFNFMMNITYMVSNSSECAVVLNGLQRNSNYCIQVRAFTIQEEGPARECFFVSNGKILKL